MPVGVRMTIAVAMSVIVVMIMLVIKYFEGKGCPVGFVRKAGFIGEVHFDGAQIPVSCAGELYRNDALRISAQGRSIVLMIGLVCTMFVLMFVIAIVAVMSASGIHQLLGQGLAICQ